MSPDENEKSPERFEPIREFKAILSLFLLLQKAAVAQYAIYTAIIRIQMYKIYI